MTLAENVSTWGPNRSMYSGLDENFLKFEKLFKQAENLEKKGKYKKALNYYNETLNICNTFAETYYRLGKCYEGIGNYSKAWSSYRRAIDCDKFPIMGISEQNDHILKLTKEKSSILIDSEKIMRDNSRNKITDYSLFIDYCHPNLEGYLLLAKAIAQEIINTFDPGRKIKKVTIKDLKKDFNIDDEALYDIYVTRGRAATRHATLRYYPEERLASAEEYFNKCINLNSYRYKAYLGMSMISFLKKDTSSGEKFLLKAKSINEKEVDEYLKNMWVKQVISRSYSE